MKSVELTAYAVREYDVKYTMIIDDTDPLIQEFLINNDLTFDDLGKLDFADYKELWETFEQFYLGLEFGVSIEEDFVEADERLVDFDAFIKENK